MNGAFARRTDAKIHALVGCHQAILHTGLFVTIDQRLRAMPAVDDRATFGPMLRAIFLGLTVALN